jgi:hypothetical protein
MTRAHWTQEEIKLAEERIRDGRIRGDSMQAIARELASELDRGVTGTYHKLREIANEMDVTPSSTANNMNLLEYITKRMIELEDKIERLQLEHSVLSEMKEKVVEQTSNDDETATADEAE